jgi:hypothetical protein
LPIEIAIGIAIVIEKLEASIPNPIAIANPTLPRLWTMNRYHILRPENPTILDLPLPNRPKRYISLILKILEKTEA